jgi:4-diphosphocytidyl-2C-methyl-D-erythritol kinase
MPMRNDLLPAALDLQPMLGDFMADVSAIWGAPVSLTGSGSACFGYFSNVDEAADAAEQFAGRGAALRPVGVKRVE